ncbi:MAG: SDR family NAD(P)-dependent oxidoreductase [Marinosulfonomonas sp.]|nr:SDR family NAD(P)-dependent oxidoreductase [Marinosulfonomonas sp.]
MTDKSILITGCSSGIGYDAARTLAGRGWRVFATCRVEADCERLRNEGLESFPLDYEDPGSIAAAMDEVLERTGGTLDALFNNGAYAIPAPVEDIPRDALRAIFEANLFGYHDLTCRVIPIMRAQGHGRIINCSSVLGLLAMRWRGAYNATKFALEALSDTLRLEMRGTGIHVSLIEPGPIATDFRINAIKQFDKWIDWENSARVDQYKADLLDQLKSGSDGNAFELAPSAVTAKLIRALQSPRPKARYFVTIPTYGANILRRFFPTRILDWLLSRG